MAHFLVVVGQLIHPQRKHRLVCTSCLYKHIYVVRIIYIYNKKKRRHKLSWTEEVTIATTAVRKDHYQTIISENIKSFFDHKVDSHITKSLS